MSVPSFVGVLLAMVIWMFIISLLQPRTANPYMTGYLQQHHARVP
jgi:hypothetical protein